MPRRHFDATVVRVETDEGLVGIGSGDTMAGFEAFAHLFVGTDPTAISRHVLAIETINFHAGRRMAHALIPAMQAQRFGRIINITGQDEPHNINAANAPNGAVHIWAKALSRSLARDGITVNSIPPGRLHSEQIDTRILPTEEARRHWAETQVPAGYIGEPEDLAVLVAFLASPRARYITGQVVHVDGGARRSPH